MRAWGRRRRRRRLPRSFNSGFKEVAIAEPDAIPDFEEMKAKDFVDVEVSDVHYSARRSSARRYFLRTRSAAASISARRVPSPRCDRSASMVMSFIDRSEYVACALRAT